jgi:alkylation response protein AidB-like acyl-CoA dehydrogenase
MISNGQNAHVMAVLCKTNSETDLPRRGLSLILVEPHRDGFVTEDLGVKMGLKMMSTASLSLSGVRVPITNLLGQLNRGFYQTLGFLNDSRVEIAGHALGGAQAALDRAIAHVTQRRQFGKRLADLQATQHKVADMATKVEAARLLVYRAAWTRDQGREDPTLSSMAKLFAARTAVEVAEEAMQLCGGSGYFLSGGLERIYRDVRVTEIYEGTREIQKNTIASRLLAEPWDVAPKGLDVDIVS